MSALSGQPSLQKTHSRVLSSGTFLAQIVQDWPKACYNIMLSAVLWFTILITLPMCRESDCFVFVLHYSLSNVPLKLGLFAPFSCSCIYLVWVVWNPKRSTALGKWESRIKQCWKWYIYEWFLKKKNLILIHCFQEFHVGNLFFWDVKNTLK